MKIKAIGICALMFLLTLLLPAPEAFAGEKDSWLISTWHWSGMR
jgi:hypothetical protein